jgi:hypothetical protein
MYPRITFRQIADGGTCIEADLMRCPDYEWYHMEESTDPAWSVVTVGSEVFALRLRGVPGILGSVPAGPAEFSVFPQGR